MRSNILKIKNEILFIACLSLFGFGCSSDKKSGEKEEAAKSPVPATEAIGEDGVGPIKQVNLTAELDQALTEKGKAIFESKCTACHKFEERYVGPALSGVTKRREPVWIMNMIMNPQEMTQKDPVAKKLLADYMTQMVNQNVTEEDTRAILEYFRSIDNQ